MAIRHGAKHGGIRRLLGIPVDESGDAAHAAMVPSRGAPARGSLETHGRRTVSTTAAMKEKACDAPYRCREEAEGHFMRARRDGEGCDPCAGAGWRGRGEPSSLAVQPGNQNEPKVTVPPSGLTNPQPARGGKPRVDHDVPGTGAEGCPREIRGDCLNVRYALN